MDWIQDYQLFLFDFDGLLVNTEEIHFQAYQRMCSGRGFSLDWDFNTYCQMAHYSSDKLRYSILQKFPELNRIHWDILYAEKKKAMMDLIQEGKIHMMPGAEAFLNILSAAGIKRCVVTHSPDDLVSLIRKQNPVLNTIPYWITREDYTHPKPDPECYRTAIKRYAESKDQVIGFEDTPRGLTALLETSARPILICQAEYPEIPEFLAKGVLRYTSLEELSQSKI